MADEILDPLEAARRVKAQRGGAGVLDPLEAARMVKAKGITPKRMYPGPIGPEAGPPRSAMTDAIGSVITSDLDFEQAQQEAAERRRNAPPKTVTRRGNLGLDFLEKTAEGVAHAVLDPAMEHYRRKEESRQNALAADREIAKRDPNAGPSVGVPRPTISPYENDVDFAKTIGKTLWGIGGAAFAPVNVAQDPKTWIPGSTQQSPMEMGGEEIRKLTKDLKASPPSFLTRDPDRPIDTRVIPQDDPRRDVSEEVAFVTENLAMLPIGIYGAKALMGGGKPPVRGSKADLGARQYRPPPPTLEELGSRVDIQPEGVSQARSGKPLVELTEGMKAERPSFQELADAPVPPEPVGRVVSPQEAARIVRERRAAEAAAPPAEAPVRPAEAVSETQKAPAPVAEGTVRLYRVEPNPAVLARSDKGAWLQKHMKPEEWQKFESERGRLFSDDLDAIEPYGHNKASPGDGAADTGMTTYYVDVPKSVADAIRRRHESGFNEYVVPPEHVAQKKPISTLQSQAPALPAEGVPPAPGTTQPSVAPQGGAGVKPRMSGRRVGRGGRQAGEGYIPSAEDFAEMYQVTRDQVKALGMKAAAEIAKRSADTHARLAALSDEALAREWAALPRRAPWSAYNDAPKEFEARVAYALRKINDERVIHRESAAEPLRLDAVDHDFARELDATQGEGAGAAYLRAQREFHERGPERGSEIIRDIVALNSETWRDQARQARGYESSFAARSRTIAEMADDPAEARAEFAAEKARWAKDHPTIQAEMDAAFNAAMRERFPPREGGAGVTLGAESPSAPRGPVTLRAGVNPLDLMSGAARLGAAPERLWAKGTAKLGQVVSKVVDKVPGARPVTNWAKSMFKTPEENISSKYAATKEGGRGDIRVGRAEGAYFGKKIEESVGGLPDIDRKGVYDYLIGDSDQLPPSVSAAQKAAIDEVSEFIDEGRRELVNRGRLSPEAYDEYNRYLRRQFENVELGRQAQEGARPFQQSGDKPRLPERWSRQDAYEARIDLPRADVDFLLREFPAMERPVYVGELKGTTLVKFADSPAGQAARDAFVNHTKTSYRQGRSTLQKQATGEIEAADVGQAKMLHKAALETPTSGELNIRTADPISPDMRELMGEDVNPATAVAKTIANTKAELAKFDMMQNVLDGSDERGAWAVRRQPGQKPSDAPPGYKHVANKRLGPLDDTFLREDVARDLEGVYGNRTPSGADQVADFMRGATDRWKTWRTVRNPAGHVQNAISAPMTAIEAGVSPFNPDNWAHYEATIRAMRNPDPFDPIQREIIRNGIDEGARLSAYELGKVRDVWSNPNSTTGYKIGQTLTDPVWWTKTAADFDQAAGTYYNFVDRLVRQSLYRKLRAEGLSPERATIQTDKFTTNYAKQGRFIQAMRHAPLAPFISYAYERLRVLKNNVAEHPTRAAATLAAGYALQQAIESTLGSDVSDAEKKAAHQEYGGSRWGGFGDQFSIVVGRREDGKPRVWNAGPLFTLDRPLRGPKDVLDESALVQNAKWLASTFGFESGPLTTQLASQAYGRDMFTGKEFLDFEDRAESFGREILPPFTYVPGLGALGSKAQKIEKSFAGEQYAKSKPPISGIESLLDTLLHIRLDGYSPQQSTMNLLRDAERESGRNDRRFDEAIDDAKGDPEKSRAAGATLGAAERELWRRFGEKQRVHQAATLGAGSR